MSENSNESLLEFPCEFPIKMMGRIHDDDGVDFRDTAIVLVEKHAGRLSETAISVAPSSKGNFVSVTITIVAESQNQLDNIYRDLTDHEEVLVAL